jgi:maleate isomerase
MWKPDGWGQVTRLGLLVPHADVGPESEFQAMAPEDVMIHATRVKFAAMAAGGSMDPTIALEPVRAFAEPPFVDDAAELLAASPIDAIGFAFTSSAYVIGAEGEAEMLGRLQDRTRGIRVTAACAAAVKALRSLGVAALAVVSPPWFDDHLASLGAEYFQDQGFEVVFSESAGLPSDQASIDPAELVEWAVANLPSAAGGVFIGGNGFRAVGVIDVLERELAMPVVTANQALFWELLGLAGYGSGVPGYGRLLA